MNKNNRKTPTPPKPTTEEAINAAIEKTGFALEDYVNSEFESLGWNTIPNRYYIDDHSSAVREIDLIAYKTRTTGSVRHTTAVIVSCKKLADRSFTFLVRDKKENDPNVNWHPIKIFSGMDSIKYYLLNGLNDLWIKKSQESDLYNKTINVKNRLFAAQEICLSNQTAQNDTAIFGSITSLMKAQSYEMASLEARMQQTQNTYSMHLLTVADCDMYTVKFSPGGKRVINKTSDEFFLTVTS
jgi:hypothetical protein